MISTRQGPAGQCGQISVGDLLHGIGDHPVYELDPAQTTALILGSPGSEISLWISDADYDPDAEETGAPAEGTGRVDAAVEAASSGRHHGRGLTQGCR